MRWRLGIWLLVLFVFTASAMLALSSGQPRQSQDKNKDKDAETVELPEGEGKVILERACTTCHDLGGLKDFKGNYTEELWRDLIVDMVRVGAKLNGNEINILAKYLAEHFGPEKK